MAAARLGLAPGLAFQYQGKWAQAASYNKNDVVIGDQQDQLYLCAQACSGTPPTTDLANAFWIPFSVPIPDTEVFRGPWTDQDDYVNANVVQGSDKSLYIAIQPSGKNLPPGVGPKDPTDPANAAYWDAFYATGAQVYKCGQIKLVGGQARVDTGKVLPGICRCFVQLATPGGQLGVNYSSTPYTGGTDTQFDIQAVDANGGAVATDTSQLWWMVVG